MPFLDVPKSEVAFFHLYLIVQTEHRESFCGCSGSVISGEIKIILVYKIASHLLTFTHGASIHFWSRLGNMLTALWFETHWEIEVNPFN